MKEPMIVVQLGSTHRTTRFFSDEMVEAAPDGVLVIGPPEFDFSPLEELCVAEGRPLMNTELASAICDVAVPFLKANLRAAVALFRSTGGQLKFTEYATSASAHSVAEVLTALGCTVVMGDAMESARARSRSGELLGSDALLHDAFQRALAEVLPKSRVELTAAEPLPELHALIDVGLRQEGVVLARNLAWTSFRGSEPGDVLRVRLFPLLSLELRGLGLWESMTKVTRLARRALDSEPEAASLVSGWDQAIRIGEPLKVGLHADFESQLQTDVESGYGIETELFADFMDALRRQAPTLGEADLTRWEERLRRAFDAQAKRESTWTEATVNDRISLAFQELTDLGIVALENAGYTQSDGWENVHEVAQEIPDAWAGTFFHGQDIERGLLGEGLLLSFGAFFTVEENESETLRVARIVCDVLAKHNVPTTWDGTAEERVAIDPFEWRKRRRAPEGE